MASPPPSRCAGMHGSCLERARPRWSSSANASRIAKLGEATLRGLEQYAINKFAEAFEVIPKTLAENAGKDNRTCVSSHRVKTRSLYAAHKKGQANAGVDIDEGNDVARRARGQDLRHLIGPYGEAATRRIVAG